MENLSDNLPSLRRAFFEAPVGPKGDSLRTRLYAEINRAVDLRRAARGALPMFTPDGSSRLRYPELSNRVRDARIAEWRAAGMDIG